MDERIPLEIERKYLIRRPPEALLREKGFTRTEIAQTYLRPETPDETARVRAARDEAGNTVYTHTVKRRVGELARREREETVSEPAYLALLGRADTALRRIEKTRWRAAYGGYTLEVDVFPFWEKQALLEVELAAETERPPLPAYLTVLREVSTDGAYTNRALAEQIPNE